MKVMKTEETTFVHLLQKNNKVDKLSIVLYYDLFEFEWISMNKE
jgi:hypothetical protein